MAATNSLRRRTLRMTYVEGVLYAFMVGSTEAFGIFYAVKQGISDFELATLTMVPVLIGAIANWIIPQLISDRFLRFGLMVSVGIQWFGILGLFLSVNQPQPFNSIFVSLSLYWIGGMTSGPLWIDRMTPWLPKERVGRFLSRRNAFVAAMTLVTYLGGALILQRADSLESFRYAFAFALVARFISWCLLWTHASPPEVKLEREGLPPLSSILQVKPLLLVFIFTFLFRLVANLASPFFIPYMIHDLKMDVVTYAVLTAIPFLGRSLFLAPWGEASRTYRPLVGLQISMIGIGLVCLFWSVIQSTAGLAFVEVFSGIFWGGFELSCVLILTMFAHGKARGLIGFHGALMNLGAMLGAYLGGSLLHWGWVNIHVFEFSAVLRLSVAAVFILVAFRHTEMRVGIKVYGDFLASALSLRPSLENLGRIIPLRRIKYEKFSDPKDFDAQSRL